MGDEGAVPAGFVLLGGRNEHTRLDARAAPGVQIQQQGCEPPNLLIPGQCSEQQLACVNGMFGHVIDYVGTGHSQPFDRVGRVDRIEHG